MTPKLLPIIGFFMRVLRLAAIPLFLFPLGISVSVVVVPMLSAAESHENRGSRESNEELTWGRVSKSSLCAASGDMPRYLTSQHNTTVALLALPALQWT